MYPRKIFLPPYLLLGLFLLGWISLSAKVMDPISEKSVRGLSFLWNQAKSVRGYVATRPGLFPKTEKVEKEGILSVGIQAPVIYRDPSSWSSSLWVGVGRLQASWLRENSPVVQGHSLIGLVDYVGKNQARVRLITDAAICPAVQVCRGGVQNRELASLLEAVEERLSFREELKARYGETFFQTLSSLTSELKKEADTFYLAKGELRGSAYPLWRARSLSLTGLGFHYDYPKGTKSLSAMQSVRLIEEGDLLVTSGLDGVFPKNLFVATVTRVLPNRASDISYQIEASPSGLHLQDLERVTILPALEEGVTSIPDFFER